MPRSLCALLLCAGLSTLAFAQATPPTPSGSDEEAAVFQQIFNRIRFEDDGTGVRDTTAVIRIQSQAGVKQWGQMIFGYSSATEDLDVDYVRVRKPDGKVVDTPTTGGQDFAPEVLRDAPAYSDYRQRHFSVVSLQPGDLLEYHSIIRVKTPLAPHQFWYEHVFPKYQVVNDDRLEIDVPKSRQVKLKSPDNKYEMKETADRRIYSWSIQNFTPKKPEDIEEDDGPYDYQPDVQLTTFANWQEIANWYAKLQGERVVVDDDVRRKAADLTKGATTQLEKTQRLYDYVAQNIRYVSLSFGVGRLQPHASAEVLRNGYGDCKDKHTLLEALLRAENIPSYPVLIHSSRKLDFDVPSPSQFDHEITAVKFGDTLTWLDSTAEVAPYGLILYQLRNKEALIASTDAFGGIRKTPVDAPVSDKMTLKLDGKFTEDGALDVGVDVVAQGDSDVHWRYIFRTVPQPRWKDFLQYFSGQWGVGGDVTDIRVESMEDISKPLHLTYHFHKDNYFDVPDPSVNFRLLPPMELPRLPRPDPHTATLPLNVGPANEQLYHARILLPANFSIQTPIAVNMSRDYGEYSSSYKIAKNVLEAERRLVFKINELAPSRRADYGSFRNTAASNEEQVLVCSISIPAGGIVAATIKPGDTPEQMRKAGAAALQRRDFASAVELLKQSLDKKADQKDAWDDLGLAYAGLSNHDEAARAFRKQIELDPYHSRANNDLAQELQQQGKFDEAIAAYRKQIELAPYEKSSHKALGLLLVQLKRDTEAKPELEAAAAIPPEDPEIKIALAQLYGRTGDQEKAAAMMKSVTGVSGPAGTDVYVSALRDDVDPRQTERDARKTLDDIGDQFDSGEYDRLGPSAFSAMNLVALAWARMGWAKFLQGDMMESIQFLNSSWLLSQSGTVGNRLGRVFEKEGQNDKARHMFALAAAAGGADAAASRAEAAKLSNAAAAEKEISDAAAELLQLRTIKLTGVPPGSGNAVFNLVFDRSTKPERAEMVQGDAEFRSTGAELQQKDFPVKFPDVSSIKIIRRGALICGSAGCSIVLQLPEGMNTSPAASTAQK